MCLMFSSWRIERWLWLWQQPMLGPWKRPLVAPGSTLFIASTSPMGVELGLTSRRRQTFTPTWNLYIYFCVVIHLMWFNWKRLEEYQYTPQQEANVYFINAPEFYGEIQLELAGWLLEGLNFILTMATMTNWLSLSPKKTEDFALKIFHSQSLLP